MSQSRYLAELILGRPLTQLEFTKELRSINKRKVTGIVIFTQFTAEVYTIERPISVDVPVKKRQPAAGRQRHLAGSPAAAARPCTV